MTTQQFIESPKYAELHEALQNELNHNNITFNTGIRNGQTFIRTFSNLINHSHRNKEFVKSDAERMLLKEMKTKYKSKAVNLINQRADLLNHFLKYGTDEQMPNWNLKIILLNN